MLIQFSVKNFKTFKEKAVLSLVASNYDRDTREEENIAIESNFNLRILKSAVLYGANASGKSKFMEALTFMRGFVISSSKDSIKGEPIKVEPFRLSTETENLPSEFEVIFTFQGTMFRYGFEVNNKIVVAEWLYSKPKTKEIELFYRDHQKFKSHSRNFSKGNIVIKEKLVRDNALWISVAAQFNDTISNNIITWFKNLKTISCLEEDGYQGFTMEKTQEPDARTGPILDVLEKGFTLVLDEPGSKLHPNLVCKIVSLFNSKEFNKKNAQLIFNTHDTNLLNSGLFRKDQIWFTEKDKYGQARLFSLADFKSTDVKKNERFEACPHLPGLTNFNPTKHII